MSPAEREQLIAMSPAGRISHYLKKKIAGTITAEKYEKCIEYALSLPYSSPKETPGEIRAGDGQPPLPVEPQDGTDVVQSSRDRRKAEQTLGEDTYGDALERYFTPSFSMDSPRIDTIILANRAPKESTARTIDTKENGGSIQQSTKDGQDGSQKDRLLRMLQDGQWHDTPSIQREVYGADHLGVARIGARADDLRNDGHTIESKKVSKTIWAYRLVKKDGYAETIKNIASG